MNFHIITLFPSIMYELIVVALALGAFSVSDNVLISITLLYFAAGTWWTVVVTILLTLIGQDSESGVKTGFAYLDTFIIFVAGMILLLPVVLLSVYAANHSSWNSVLLGSLYFFSNIAISVFLGYFFYSKELLIKSYREVKFKMFWFIFPAMALSALALPTLGQIGFLKYYIVTLFTLLAIAELSRGLYIMNYNK